MDVNDLFELWRSGFAYGLQVTLLVCFVPAALSGVWNLLNMAN